MITVFNNFGNCFVPRAVNRVFVPLPAHKQPGGRHRDEEQRRRRKGREPRGRPGGRDHRGHGKGACRRYRECTAQLRPEITFLDYFRIFLVPQVHPDRERGVHMILRVNIVISSFPVRPQHGEECERRDRDGDECKGVDTRVESRGEADCGEDRGVQRQGVGAVGGRTCGGDSTGHCIFFQARGMFEP